MNPVRQSTVSQGHSAPGSLSYLIVPGWNGSGPDHWQRHWERTLPRAHVVEQGRWDRPTLREWVDGLDRALAAIPGQVVLVGHSLGCITVAHWSEVRDARRVAGALLVAPADVDRADRPAALAPFAPLPLQPLPFPSLLIASSDDPAATPGRARLMAERWGSRFLLLEDVGHINAASGHHRWEEGRELLENYSRSLTGAAARPLSRRHSPEPDRHRLP